MQPAEALLQAALQAAPRRYRLPPLPADPRAAAAQGLETALACALEAARRGDGGAWQDLFTASLATLIREALQPQAGDPAFQALVLRTGEPEVEEHARLAAQEPADRRALRTQVDAAAHPGKLRGLPPGAARDALARLHTLAGAGDWAGVRAAADLLPAVQANPALARLERGAALLSSPAVRHYRELCTRHGPPAGSDAATARGRAAARTGAAAERAAVAAFEAIAQLLAPPGADLRVLRSLRPARGFPGAAANAKDEWDVALLQGTPARIVLLAEVKASPAAAAADFTRLLRGLRRLAAADPQQAYAFGSADGQVKLPGAALRELQPTGHALPARVIYCCTAPPEARPQMLGAAGKSVLVAEPASLAFARAVAAGAAPPQQDLAPVWQALTREPRLRAALHQYQTAQAVRAAMLHPDDLLAAVRCLVGS